MTTSARQYLLDVLRLDPRRDARQICELHDRFHDGEPATPAADQSGAPDRRAVQQALDAWRTPDREPSDAELEESLAALAVERFPDLQRVAERLLTVARARDWLETLARRSDVDARIVRFFRMHWRAPVQQAPLLRASYEAWVRGEAQDEAPALQGASRRQVRRFLGRVRRQQPALFALDAAWCLVALRMRRWVKLPSLSDSILFGLLVLLVGVFVAATVLHFSS